MFVLVVIVEVVANGPNPRCVARSVGGPSDAGSSGAPFVRSSSRGPVNMQIIVWRELEQKTEISILMIIIMAY